VVAGLHVRHLVADGLDHAGRLVADDDRHLRRVLRLEEVEVAVAETGSCGADENLARARLVDRHLFDLELARTGVEDGCLHGGDRNLNA
jgi:hypothetical protein